MVEVHLLVERTRSLQGWTFARKKFPTEQRTLARSAVWRDLHLGNLLTRFNRTPSSQTLWLVLDDVGVLFNPSTKSRTNFANYIYNVVSGRSRSEWIKELQISFAWESIMRAFSWLENEIT